MDLTQMRIFDLSIKQALREGRPFPSNPDGSLTEEQAALLTAATEGHVLLTVCGCNNDILWGLLSDRGWMEPAELPKELSSAVAGLDWHAWKMTEAGRAALTSPTPS